MQTNADQLAAEMPFGARQYLAHTSSAQRRHREYLGSDHWKAFAAEIRSIRRWKCEVRRSHGWIVHHRHYNTWGHERPEDVMLVCDRCHRDIHRR